PTITSGGAAAFQVGQPGAFTVTTAPGSPASVTLTETGTLPAGVTFHDNGDGTATLAGTPTAGGDFPVTVHAANGDGTQSTQALLTLTVALANGTGVANSSGATVSVAPDTQSLPPAPAGFTRTSPVYDITATGAAAGGRVAVTFTAATGQSFAGAVYLKYGPNPADGGRVEWYPYSDFQVSADGHTATLGLTDGGLGDDDGAANGTIQDPGAFASSNTATAVAAGPLVASGSTNGSAVVFPAGTGGPYAATPSATLSPFGSVPANVRTAIADVNGDGVPDTILVTSPGTPIRVAVVSGADNTTVLVPPFDPFGGDFTGGGFVAAGDFDHAGRAEFVVTPDEGGGPRVSIFSLGTGGAVSTVANFFGIDDPNFRGGARAAAGDVNGDGTPDVVVAAGFGGGPRVAVFDGKTLTGGNPTRLVTDFFAFPGADATTLRNGTYVAVGDVDGDGFADLIFGGGPGGAPRVTVLSGALVGSGNVAGAQAAPLGNFFVAGAASDRGGVRVAAVADGSGKANVAAGSGAGDPARVRVYPGTGFAGGGEPATFQDLTPFGGAVLADGVYVG
ncbi:MAG TPA: choice-of-anchor U domain-containing protein, partial [Urbifossiella sp.]|nr:choice-of-anchor U domain-containing protein [Urbifossiella sp.]